MTRPKLTHLSTFFERNSPNPSPTLSLPLSVPFLLLKFDQTRKDAVSEEPSQLWHNSIHPSLMWQVPLTAKLQLLHCGLLITVDKHAGGDRPLSTSIRTN